MRPEIYTPRLLMQGKAICICKDRSKTRKLYCPVLDFSFFALRTIIKFVPQPCFADVIVLYARLTLPRARAEVASLTCQQLQSKVQPVDLARHDVRSLPFPRILFLSLRMRLKS